MGNTWRWCGDPQLWSHFSYSPEPRGPSLSTITFPDCCLKIKSQRSYSVNTLFTHRSYCENTVLTNLIDVENGVCMSFPIGRRGRWMELATEGVHRRITRKKFQKWLLRHINCHFSVSGAKVSLSSESHEAAISQPQHETEYLWLILLRLSSLH